MPVVHIMADQRISWETTHKIKALGQLIDYTPEQIWIVTEDGMRQNDVAFVLVMAMAEDVKKMGFAEFCDNIGKIMRQDLGKSVEVALPGNCCVQPLSWSATTEGADRYGP